ncbi:MAG: hypothetical protein [Circular genetic element sp.]|nr:MAG: hypothetical protein [Circular genetic element sp.]
MELDKSATAPRFQYERCNQGTLGLQYDTPPGGRRMKCTNCKTECESEATDRGICFDCYCELDLLAYNEHLKLNPARKYLEEE